MKEVIYRRYFKTIMNESYKPDLIVMDGGKAQIDACKEVLDSLNLYIPIIGLVKDDKHRTNHIMNENLEILDVPKDSKLFLFLTRIQDEVHRYAITYHRNIKAKGAMELITPLNEIDNTLKLLENDQDHEVKIIKIAISKDSSLNQDMDIDEINGKINDLENKVSNYNLLQGTVKNKTNIESKLLFKKELLKKFGSLKKMKEASVDELSEVVNREVAEKLFEYLKEI